MNMANMNFTLAPLLLLLLLTACSSHQRISEPNRPPETKAEHKQTLCTYKKEKGIAEVILVKPHSYQFRFYLGDDIFELDKDAVPSRHALTIGDEFKAVKAFSIHNTERHDCPSAVFHLVP